MDLNRVVGSSSALIAVLAIGVLAATAAPPTRRSVYVTVVDNQGRPLTDLTTADFTLKEGGRDREIAVVEIAKAPLQIALAVEQTLYTEQPSAVNPDHVLNLLRDSHALFHSISIEFGGASTAAGQLEDNAGRAQVLDDGPKQAGGRRWPVAVATAIPDVLRQIAGDLSSQYKITYTLPDGQKPSERLQVTTKRRGVTLRSPSRISDKF